ncbi:hypothetical protein SAMN05444163_6594 [Bradyrhizobium ottawaense]|uniref:Uncharacterized protein n=1 Tax=Bradyrhizobium ottawaense TaxID=931866 RepID=A0ABY0QBS6_9BRAD|nr:hypothetical protein SAMN05444163_6594 [Bradyrhizobium ottawaense]
MWPHSTTGQWMPEMSSFFAYPPYFSSGGGERLNTSPVGRSITSSA